MKRVIEFKVPGAAFGKQRPRAAMRGKHIAIYTPNETVNYESLVKLMASQAMHGGELISGAVKITMLAIYPIPESWSKKKKSAAYDGDIRPVVKPDFDNIAKIISDSLNKIVWNDDSQVCEGTVKKFYGGNPGVTVIIEEF